MKLYHGARHFFPCAFELKPQHDGYTHQPESQALEDFIDLHRPYDKLSRKQSVFLSDDIDLIDPAGGFIDAVYLVEADKTEKSDLAWYTHAQIMLEEGNTELAAQAALNYWSGEPFTDTTQRCPEYRCSTATVIAIVELNADMDELEQVP
ncbi:hypothetical protein OTK49_28390 [Vibrio coralliirubri]|uniref:hypothetical protein n=1 Tax=Vibrio coralliirubri TaxID=1516159 RepID=UPI00228362B8|nr:hypothetical protein [Vibrio coralliirubri]MCY9866463.1 hypothetical protein [Vibrio coralliirubri]